MDVDLVVSDDGSSDTTMELLCKFVDGNRARVISPTPPTGFAAQNFFFLIQSILADNYDFVALSEQDDIWDEEKLVMHAMIFEKAGFRILKCYTSILGQRP